MFNREPCAWLGWRRGSIGLGVPRAHLHDSGAAAYATHGAVLRATGTLLFDSLRNLFLS